MLIVVAPSAITASSTRHRKSGSRAVAVLGRELDVAAQVAREAHRQLRLLEHLLGRHAQLLLHVQRRGRDEGVDARRAAPPFSASAARVMSRSLARAQRAHGRVPDRAGDRLHRLEVAVRATPRSRPRSRRPCSRSSWRAMRSFSSLVIEAPGDCSPSRKVVSKMIRRSVMAIFRRQETKRPAAFASGPVDETWGRGRSASPARSKKKQASSESDRDVIGPI